MATQYCATDRTYGALQRTTFAPTRNSLALHRNSDARCRNAITALNYDPARALMDSKMKAILDSTPDSPTRSKLEPYRELIRGLRQKRKTFPEIAQMLLANYNVHIHPSNIHRFVKVRSKQQRSQFEIPPDSSPNSAAINATSQFASAQSCSPALTAITAHKRFHFDPEEGLTLSDEVLNLKPKKD